MSQATPALAHRAFKITLRRSELAMNFDFMARVADFLRFAVKAISKSETNV